mgnify:CR=1 FL=1
MSVYDVLAERGFLKQVSHEEEIRELTKLRDWLLPMLMNGQARVE